MNILPRFNVWLFIMKGGYCDECSRPHGCSGSVHCRRPSILDTAMSRWLSWKTECHKSRDSSSGPDVSHWRKQCEIFFFHSMFIIHVDVVDSPHDKWWWMNIIYNPFDESNVAHTGWRAAEEASLGNPRLSPWLGFEGELLNLHCLQQ